MSGARTKQNAGVGDCPCDLRAFAVPLDSASRLHARIAELERRNAQLDRFAATVAHELRTPLVSIEGYAALLEEHLADVLDGPAREELDSVRRATRWMLVVIETQLQLARSQQRPLQRRRIALDRLAKECAATLGPELAACHASVALGALPVVKGDRAMLRTVLLNLLGNALRYGSRRSGIIRLGARREPGAWRIEVDNEGAPITAADRERIFEPFQRSTVERRADGLGLGLSICKTIVEHHGGGIGVEPLAGGNRFWFTLPA
jgi:signal transduction histidine kinase